VRLRNVVIVIGLVLLVSGAALAQSLTYSGTLNATTPSMDYKVTLNAGDTIIATTEITSGNLDTVLALIDPSGVTLAENDDRQADTLESAIGFTATTTGAYTVRVSRYAFSENSGNFTVDIEIGDESLLGQLELITRVQLSGPMLTRDTEHFRIHYTLEGDDATTEELVNALATSVEEIYRIQIGQMGWQPPPSDGVRGGNALYDVYMADLYGDAESALGYASPEDLTGDNPSTPDVVERGASSYIVIENDFDIPRDNAATATSLLRTTMSHEFNHAIQFGYSVDGIRLYFEATATWMETAALLKDEDASGYVQYIYKYPELCFGSDSQEAEGLTVYGHWLFIQSMVDAYGMDVVQSLWKNIARHPDGLDALEQTLVDEGSTLEASMASYHIRNLVRDYGLATLFDDTVWREQTINGAGRWKYTGRGIQELAANYFEVTLPAGRYYTGLVNDGGLLDLWAVGVRGSEADVIPLARGGTIDTAGYDHYYLMVFNPQHDDPSDCRYYDYSIDLIAGKDVANTVLEVRDAQHFRAIR
jgi:hypothetical protein